MTSHGIFCPNVACPARGQADQGNIRVHSQQEQRYRCTVCRSTFAASKGTPFYRLHHDRQQYVVNADVGASRQEVASSPRTIRAPTSQRRREVGRSGGC